MIHFVTSLNRHLYTGALLQVHRLRKAIFVDELGWSLKVHDDGGEYDEYDDERAMYLIGFDRYGQVEISMRVRPTDDGKCMIANHFPHLIAPDEAPVCVPGVWEGSRIMSAPALRASQAARQRNHELQLATIEAASRYGIARVLGMVELFWMGKMHQALWRTRAIGLPAPHDGGDIIAFQIDSTPDAVREGRERLAVETALIELDAGAQDRRLQMEA